MRSRDEPDAATRAERSSRAPTTPCGTGRGKGTVRQASPARTDSGGDRAPSLIEQVVRRENLLAAHARVVRNAGAPGVDELAMQLHEWGRTRHAAQATAAGLLVQATALARAGALRRADALATDREIWRLAWPVILSQILASAVSLVDIAMLGRLGSSSLAAVGYVTQIFLLSQAVLFAIGVAGVALIGKVAWLRVVATEAIDPAKHITRVVWLTQLSIADNVDTGFHLTSHAFMDRRP